MATSIIQDCDTGMFLQDCSLDIPPSQKTLSTFLNISISSMSTSQRICHHQISKKNSQDMQEPKIPNLQDPWKNKRNIFGSTDKRKGCVWPRSGQQEGRFSGEKPFHAGECASYPGQGNRRHCGDKSSEPPSRERTGSFRDTLQEQSKKLSAMHSPQ